MSELPNIDLLWDYSNPVATESKMLDILSMAETSGDIDYMVQLLTQVARAQGLQCKLEKAHQTLDRVQTILNPEHAVSSIRYLLERGRIYKLDEKSGTAKSYFQQAWSMACEMEQEFYAIDSAHMLANCEKGDTALMWNEQAIKRAETSEDRRAKEWFGILYKNRGWIHHRMGNFDKALEQFKRALEWVGGQDSRQAVRSAKWAVARTLRSLQRVTEAYEMQKELLSEYEDTGETNPYVLEELGECLLLIGHFNVARPFFAMAYEEFSKDERFRSKESLRLARLGDFANGKNGDSET